MFDPFPKVAWRAGGVLCREKQRTSHFRGTMPIYADFILGLWLWMIKETLLE